MPRPIKPAAVASQPGGVASKPAVYVQAFDTGIRGFAYEFKAPCGCRHWSTGKFEYCPGHHAAVNSNAALVQALKDLLKECPLAGRNVKKDFSFMVARAAAAKALYEAGESEHEA
jgi:hypothetical protein